MHGTGIPVPAKRLLGVGATRSIDVEEKNAVASANIANTSQTMGKNTKKGKVLQGQKKITASDRKNIDNIAELQKETTEAVNSEGRAESEGENVQGRSTPCGSSIFPGNRSDKSILRKLKMIKTRKGLMFEEDLSEEEKSLHEKQVDKYKHTHIGDKIVEASLTSSAKVGNNEANKAKILRYIYSKGYKILNIRDRGFARLELYFEDFREANRYLNDKGIEGQDKIVIFDIPRRAMYCRGIITGWDAEATLDELADAMVETRNVIEIERL